MVNEGKCRDIVIACIARLNPKTCEDICEELDIDFRTADYSTEIGRGRNALWDEFKDALTQEEEQ